MVDLKKELKNYKNGLNELQDQLNKTNQQMQLLQQQQQQIINKIIGTNANVVLLQRLVEESKEVKKCAT